MHLPKLTDIVKNNTVEFTHLRAGNMFYEVTVNSITYTFPVPLDDIGDATFHRKDKAMLFLRYIRKAIATNTFVKL